VSLCCGFCAVGQHERCTGMLRTQYGFCACWTRQHQPKPDADDPAVRARNDAVYLEYVRQTLNAGEA
jgi:hypothetical protein